MSEEVSVTSALAGGAITFTLIGAVFGTLVQGTVLAEVSIGADAFVVFAHSVTGAVIDTFLLLTELSFIAWFASAFVVEAVSSIQAVLSALSGGAVEAFEARITNTLEVLAFSVTRTVVWAFVVIAFRSNVPWVTDAFVSPTVALAMTVAVILAEGNGTVKAFPAFVAFAAFLFALAMTRTEIRAD